MWVKCHLSTARVFDTPHSVDTGGYPVDKKSFRNQSETTIVHNPHTYFLLLPNPSLTYKEMWNDEIPM
jgi:hypothetical protein